MSPRVIHLAEVLGAQLAELGPGVRALSVDACSTWHRQQLDRTGSRVWWRRMLLGDDESGLVSVARALHRSADGAGRPFIVCDQRSRQATGSAAAAVHAARGGSLCVRRRRLPIDFPSAVPMLRDPTVSVQLIICASMRFDPDPFLACPVPIVVPSIRERGSELTKIVDEYALDAIGTLGNACFFDADRAWVLEHAAGSLAEVETAPCGSWPSGKPARSTRRRRGSG